jgi:hypothetical protein
MDNRTRAIYGQQNTRDLWTAEHARFMDCRTRAIYRLQSTRDFWTAEHARFTDCKTRAVYTIHTRANTYSFLMFHYIQCIELTMNILYQVFHQ